MIDASDAPAATVGRMEDRITAQGDLTQAGVVAPLDEPPARETLAENVTPARESAAAREPAATATADTAMPADQAGTAMSVTRREEVPTMRDEGDMAMDDMAMDRDMTITEGMPVYGADDQQLGTVERIHGGGFHVNGQHYDREQVARVAGGAIHLRGGASATAEGQAAATGRVDIGAVQDDEIRVSVAEERLAVGTREVDLGEVEIRKTVETEEVSVPVTLTRDEVIVNEVRVDERPATGEDLFEEGTIRVAVRGEEAVVAKETIITGEVVVETDTTAEERQITDTVRRQRVEVERHDGDSTGEVRINDAAEPGYDTGFAAGGDARYAGREWANVEPELQRDYEARGGHRDRWAELRADIQAGWEKARGR